MSVSTVHGVIPCALLFLLLRSWLGAPLRRLDKSRSYQATRATLRSLLGAQPVRIVSKRLPTLRRAIATAQFGRGARYMCGQGSLSAVFLVNK
jgi:hypothetical protein